MEEVEGARSVGEMSSRVRGYYFRVERYTFLPHQQFGQGRAPA